MKLWSWSTGDRAVNRVRVCERRAGGVLMLEWYAPDRAGGKPKVKRQSLGHRDRELARQRAEELSSTLRRTGEPASLDLTLHDLLTWYLREVTPTKSVISQAHDIRTAALLEQSIGRDRRVRSLNKRDWDTFIENRRSGKLHRHAGGVLEGRQRKTTLAPARPRAIEQDLKFLLAVLHWATRSKSVNGTPFLDRNPLAGLVPPRELAPARPMLSDEEYQRMLAIANDVHPVMRVLLVIAHETGHRIGAVRQLEWKDLDMGNSRVLWPAHTDKLSMAHITPLTTAACHELEAFGMFAAHDGPVFVETTFKRIGQYSDRIIGEPPTHEQTKKWWRRAMKLAKVAPRRGLGWHSLRRKFATELKGSPLSDVAALGGWKDKGTLLRVYQAPDEATMSQALANRRPLKKPAIPA